MRYHRLKFFYRLLPLLGSLLGYSPCAEAKPPVCDLTQIAPSPYTDHENASLTRFFSAFQFRFSVLEYARASPNRRAQIRKELGETASTLEKLQSSLESAMSKSPLTKKLTVFRGENFLEGRALPKEGEVLEYPQLLSTTKSVGLAATYSEDSSSLPFMFGSSGGPAEMPRSQKVVFEIRLPRGQPCLDVKALTKTLDLATGSYSAGVIDSEVVLPRKLKLKIIERREEIVPWGRANYGVKVEYCVAEVLP